MEKLTIANYIPFKNILTIYPVKGGINIETYSATKYFTNGMIYTKDKGISGEFKVIAQYG